MKKHFDFLILAMATALAITTTLTACGPGSEDSSLSLNANDSSGVINGTKVTARRDDGSRGVVLFQPVNSIGMATGICTATLLSDHSFLTAAHCFDKKKTPSLSRFKIIFANEKGLFTDREHQRSGSQIVIHPQFRKTKVGLLNDVAVGFFEGGIPAGFEPIEIERDQNKNYQNQFLNIFGYGKTKDSAEIFAIGYGSAGELRKAVVKLNGAYGLMQDRYAILSNGNTQFICSGDSGSGQFVNVNGVPRLIGVTSSVTGIKKFAGHVSCTQGRSTAMKVSYFAKWIDEVHEAARR
ncbi:S1 family peptidase [Bdellovibrio sp. HCB185ZH]|uniref:S1 family peptidase n=1 Tax=Bdellovibrio sp. HCB185ZH TaxID=3394235 RepID=UPI0039A440D8